MNDVVATRAAAYFTDSNRPVLYRVPLGPNGAPGAAFETVNLSGDYVQAPGFNVNGIDATRDGKTLVIVQSGTGKLFTVVAQTGVASEIDLGGATVTNGDGPAARGAHSIRVRNSPASRSPARVDLGSGVAFGGDDQSSRCRHDRRLGTALCVTPVRTPVNAADRVMDHGPAQAARLKQGRDPR